MGFGCLDWAELQEEAKKLILKIDQIKNEGISLTKFMDMETFGMDFTWVQIWMNTT
jgi:hypothetical protein